MTKKTAILIRCTPEEADLIRHAAASERRTLSGFVLNTVMNRIKVRSQMGAPVVPTIRRKSDSPDNK